jgi:cyanophycinase
MMNASVLQRALLVSALLGTSAAPAACLSVEAESNNTEQKANTGLCSGVGASGAIASAKDEDWFRIDVAGAGTVTVSLAHDNGIDLDWYVSRPGGVAVTYRSTLDNPEAGSFSAPAAGAYYIRVKSHTGLGRYTLSVNYPSAPPDGGGTPLACALPRKVNLGKVGNPTPRNSVTSGGIVLMGGGLDVDQALKWMIGKSGGGDFVVLRSSGTDAYNDYIYAMGGANSVQTLLVTSISQANDACVVQTIKNAGAVFLAGGDQADYVNYFKGQGVGAALNYLINTKRAPVGGTSAGMAVQGQFYHPGGADNSTVLLNPTAVAMGNNFLAHGGLNNLVTEPHFAERARQPRLTAFMASSIYNFGAPWQAMRGVAADERTAIAIDAAGVGSVFGSGNAHFVMGTGAPETLAPAAPLTWLAGGQALKVFQVPANATGSNTFNLGTWSGASATVHYWSVNNGSMTIN